VPVESAAQIADREEAKKHLKERRLKAKKKREAKQQQELALALQEKQAMEDELEDLKLSNATEGEEMMERKLTKIRKKYEKKIGILKADIVDAAEVRGCSFYSLILEHVY
jgi:flagellar biosynthesis component FlhA